jgi:glycosyltransferase involved in cell wall biosynthesis
MAAALSATAAVMVARSEKLCQRLAGAIIDSMRVLLVSPYGADVNPYISLLSEGLTSAGATVSVTRRLTRADVDGAGRPDVIHLHWLEGYDPPPPFRPHASSAPLRAVERGMIRLSALPPARDYRHARRYDALFALLTGFQRAGGRVAYTAHNLDPHESANAAQLRALRRMIREADLVHAHDRATADELARRFGRRERVPIIPHGHYLSAYPNTVTRASARAALQLSPDAFVYLSIGLLRPYKGLEELLSAFRLLNDDKTRLLIAGKAANPAYVGALTELAAGDARIRLEPRFVPGDELQRYFNAADVVVLPYRQITTSGAALLAFSFGAPVVAPAIGAFPELLAEERGALYQPGELASALRRVRAREWGAARPGIIEWVRRFDWTGIGRALLRAYEQGGASR